MSLRQSCLLVVLVLALCPGSAGAQATGSFMRTLEAGGLRELDVSTGSGSIDIAGGPGSEIVIAGHIEVRRSRGQDPEAIVDEIEAAPPIELDGQTLRIGDRDPRRYRAQVSISYEIRLPAGMSVVSETGSGSQTVTGIDAEVEASTGSGAIVLTSIGGEVIAETGSGRIQADAIAGAFNGRTGSGVISLTQTASGDVRASTGSGRIELRGVVGGLNATTGSGRIEVDGQQTAAWDLKSGSGSITVRLPADAAFTLDAQTSSGSLDIDHPVTMQGSLRRNQLRGTVRGGGPMLRIGTGSGNIRIE